MDMDEWHGLWREGMDQQEYASVRVKWFAPLIFANIGNDYELRRGIGLLPIERQTTE